MASRVTINGVMYEGNSVSISRGKVFIDGHDYSPNEKEINIHIDGNIENLNVDYCKQVTVSGNVGRLKSTSGDIECGNVDGDVTTTSGNIECEDVGGRIKTTSGDVKTNNVIGDVNTLSGNIKYKK